MRFVTVLAAGVGLGYALTRFRRHDSPATHDGPAQSDRPVQRDSAAVHDSPAKGGMPTPGPMPSDEPGPAGGAKPPAGGGVGPVLDSPVRPASLQGAAPGDALLLLAGEHDDLMRSVAELMSFDAAGPHETGDLRAAVQRAVSAASRHEAAEEEHFWPFVRERLADGDALADTGAAHELEMKRLLQTLDSRRPGDIDWDELLSGLERLMADHIGFEEGSVWPALEAEMTPEERLAMGGDLTRAEEIAPTRPHPSELADPARHPKLSKAVALVDRGVDRVSARGRGPHD